MFGNWLSADAAYSSALHSVPKTPDMTKSEAGVQQLQRKRNKKEKERRKRGYRKAKWKHQGRYMNDGQAGLRGCVAAGGTARALMLMGAVDLAKTFRCDVSPASDRVASQPCHTVQHGSSTEYKYSCQTRRKHESTTYVVIMCHIARASASPLTRPLSHNFPRAEVASCPHLHRRHLNIDRIKKSPSVPQELKRSVLATP